MNDVAVKKEDATVIKKEIEALIETVLMKDPSLKGRLNAQVVWNYLQLPDESFGWCDGWKGGMPWRAKVMSVMAHLENDVSPGYGHILFLGNKLYQTADLARKKLFEDSDLEGYSVKFSPLTTEEKEMYCLEKDDLSIKCILTGEYRGSIVLWEGVGIIDANERVKTDSKGKLMGMFATKKNLANTLQTRALHNLIKYNYKTKLPVAPSEDEIIEIQQSEPAQKQQLDYMRNNSDESDLAKTREKIKEENETEKKAGLAKTLQSMIQVAKENYGVDRQELLAALNVKDISATIIHSNCETLDNLCTQISVYLASLQTLSQSKEPKSAEKKTRGRPKKDDVKEAPMVVTVDDLREEKDIEDNLLEAPNDDMEGLEEPSEEDFLANENVDTGEASRAIVEKFLKHPNIGRHPELFDLLTELSKLDLYDSDESAIVTAVKVAVGSKNLSKLESLIASKKRPV